MRDERLTNMEIAEKLEVSLTTLQYWINKLNLEKRTRGRLHKLDELSEPPNQTAEKEWTHVQEGSHGDLGIKIQPDFEEILRMFPETFQKLNFTVHGENTPKN